MKQRIAGTRKIGRVLREVAEHQLDLTHRSFHPFPARMPLELASTLISKLTGTSARILDPMLGSGTTAVAARQLGRSCYGSDLDPMAVMLSKTAITYYSKKCLKRVRHDVLKRASSLLNERPFCLSVDRLRMADETKEFIEYWFPKESQDQLLALARAIGEIGPAAETRLAWSVFSSLIIAKQATASFATDISRTRPRRNFNKEVVLPFDAWHRRFREAEGRLPFVGTKPATGAVCSITVDDARALSLPDASVDFVLTSPPYLNAIDYLRSHRMSLVWMGHDLGQLRELRGTMCGSERGMWQIDGLPVRLESRLTSDIVVPRQQALFRRYLADIKLVLGQVRRVLTPGGAAVIVLGSNLLAHDADDTVGVIRQLSHQAGLHFVEAATREIAAARRSLPPPSAAGESSPLRKRMRNELMIALRNPP